MRAVFADTFYWVALTNPADPYYGLVIARTCEIAQTRIVTTDKSYSMTDCISMETMRREELTEVLTNDRHFEQEGFRALFRDP